MVGLIVTSAGQASLMLVQGSTEAESVMSNVGGTDPTDIDAEAGYGGSARFVMGADAANAGAQPIHLPRVLLATEVCSTSSGSAD